MLMELKRFCHTGKSHVYTLRLCHNLHSCSRFACLTHRDKTDRGWDAAKHSSQRNSCLLSHLCITGHSSASLCCHGSWWDSYCAIRRRTVTHFRPLTFSRIHLALLLLFGVWMWSWCWKDFSAIISRRSCDRNGFVHRLTKHSSQMGSLSVKGTNNESEWGCTVLLHMVVMVFSLPF